MLNKQYMYMYSMFTIHCMLCVHDMTALQTVSWLASTQRKRRDAQNRMKQSQTEKIRESTDYWERKNKMIFCIASGKYKNVVWLVAE